MTSYTHLIFFLPPLVEMENQSEVRYRDKVFFPCRHKRIINRESVDNNRTLFLINMQGLESGVKIAKPSRRLGREISLTGNFLCTGLSLRREKSQHTIRKKATASHINRWAELRTVQVIHDWQRNENQEKACCLLSPTSHPSAKKLFILKKRHRWHMN